MATDSTEVLSLQGVQAYYGESHVMHGVDLSVKSGEVVSLLRTSRSLGCSLAVLSRGCCCYWSTAGK